MPMADGAAGVTLGALLAQSRATLDKAGIAESALDARLLVEHLTGTSRTDALVAPERPVRDVDMAAVRAAVARRAAGEPVHRILGWREFYGLRLSLSPDTLEPRPDTETLVDLVLPFVREKAAREGECRILDLGTGTGAIALALLSQVPGSSAVGVDISPGALETAAVNADITGNATRFTARQSDWFDRVEGAFHLIVANPPYIAVDTYRTLAKEVRDFDPERALVGGADGLDAYRIIAAGAGAHLAAGGMVAVETGYDQTDAVEVVFSAGGFAATLRANDLSGHQRALGFALKRPL